METNVIVEIPKNSKVKYEIDPESGKLMVDRILHTPCVYPFNYGYIPDTLGGDGDPLDAVVLTDEALYPTSIVKCRVIGVILTEDEKGVDDKLLLVPIKDPDNAHVHDISGVSPHSIEKLRFFFENYKSLEQGKWSKVKDIKGSEEAMRIIEEGLKNINRR